MGRVAEKGSHTHSTCHEDVAHRQASVEGAAAEWWPDTQYLAANEGGVGGSGHKGR